MNKKIERYTRILLREGEREGESIMFHMEVSTLRMRQSIPQYPPPGRRQTKQTKIKKAKERDKRKREKMAKLLQVKSLRKPYMSYWTSSMNGSGRRRRKGGWWWRSRCQTLKICRLETINAHSIMSIPLMSKVKKFISSFKDLVRTIVWAL